jgi:hypothetical protein
VENQGKIIAGALKECGTRELVEDVFSRFQIDHKADRIASLNECMGNPQTFFSADLVSEEDKYELTVQMFLAGSWKLKEYYDRMGFGA